MRSVERRDEIIVKNVAIVVCIWQRRHTNSHRGDKESRGDLSPVQ